jgi:hypothetical protein
MAKRPPSPDGQNGGKPPPANVRGPGGRFAPGNPGGIGNPHAKAVGQLRAAMMASVTPDDVREVVKGLVRAAKVGEPWAVREFLDRLFGKPEAFDLVEKLEALEAARNGEESER